MLGLLGGPTWSYSYMDHNVYGLFADSKHINDWVHEPSSETISMASDCVTIRSTQGENRAKRGGKPRSRPRRRRRGGSESSYSDEGEWQQQPGAGLGAGYLGGVARTGQVEAGTWRPQLYGAGRARVSMGAGHVEETCS